ITAQLYIPIRQQGLSLLYTIVQFWLLRAAILAGVVFFFWIMLPGLVKTLRRFQRQRWAVRLGPREQLAVAYAEIRDRAIDFNIGQGRSAVARRAEQGQRLHLRAHPHR